MRTMKKNHNLLGAVALLLPAASHAFLAPMAGSHAVHIPTSPSRLSQNYYDYDEDGQYYGDDAPPQEVGAEQGQPPPQQPQYYEQVPPQQPQYAQGAPQQQPPQYYAEPQPQEPPPPAEAAAAPPALLITDDMSAELTRATAGIDVGMDYLALARQRAVERRSSNNAESTAAEWIQLAEEKKRQMGVIGDYEDDAEWERSADEEGSLSDSASLGMGVKLEEAEGGVMMTEGGLVVDTVGEEGPQLLL